MEGLSPKDSSVLSSPYSSPNLSALLKIKVISWSHETGLPVTVRVRVADKSFNLHKFPLMSKSGYFKRQLTEWQEVELPENFPGGSDTFEMIALFIYGSSTFIDPFNVVSLRCAAEYLEMTEDYAPGNLCERTDLYLNQVVLQSWDDTLIVLQKTRTLLPLSEELLIVGRCIESLAFMACMEILDPERKRDRPVVSLDVFATKPWSSKLVKEIIDHELWIKDLIALPFGFFKRVTASLRRQGMKEKFVSPIIVFYANKWVLSNKTRQFWECLCDENAENNTNNSKDTSDNVLAELQGVLDILPMGEKTSRSIPVGFYFGLMERSLELGIASERKEKLQEQIVQLLHLAHVEDFLFPKVNIKDSVPFSVELATMEGIFSRYISSSMENEQSIGTGNNSIVAELWDMYLCRIATDPSIGTKRFMDLIEVVPVSFRLNHDHLYRAMNTYCQAHRDISQEEKTSVCKYLNCQKLSQEACVEAVQNEFMPLRLIVQALFVQQLNTQQAFKECSESFRFAYLGEFSGSLSSSRYPTSISQNLGESPYMEPPETVNNNNKPLLSSLLETDVLSSKNEYESTSFRIQNLEKELVSLKKSLESQQVEQENEQCSNIDGPKVGAFGMEGRSFSKRRHAFGQVTGCIGSVNLASQRKYAGRLLKMFRRITLFGRARPKRGSSIQVDN